jgi:hypothetical protein
MDLKEAARLAEQDGVTQAHALIGREMCQSEPLRTTREVPQWRARTCVFHGVDECAAPRHLCESPFRLAGASWTALAKRIGGDREAQAWPKNSRQATRRHVPAWRVTDAGPACAESEPARRARRRKHERTECECEKSHASRIRAKAFRRSRFFASAHGPNGMAFAMGRCSGMTPEETEAGSGRGR